MDRVGYGEAAPVPRIVIAVTHSADDSSWSSAHKRKKPRTNAGPKKNGSGSWIRTSDQVVNSHLLYR